jgi:hypothetical protein
LETNSSADTFFPVQVYNDVVRVGSFEISQPLPELKSPHAIAVLKPWVDCGSIGTLVLQRFETRFGARELARLARPGVFYDFTRYRPITHFKGGVRELKISNTTISFARSEKENDMVFIHLLEPHNLGETYCSSVWQMLKILGIKRYCLLGSFYDSVPHTRPILISGGSSSKRLQTDLGKIGLNQSRYEGPTTICNLISQEAEKEGVETLTFMVHLPYYTELEEDYMGVTALVRVLHSLYDISIDDSDLRRAEAQLKALETAVQQDHKLKTLVAHLETQYDARLASSKAAEQSQLSPEVDKFLKEMEKRFKES